MVKSTVKEIIKFMYPNIDQFISNKEEVGIFKELSKPDIKMITEMISKAQVNPIHEPLLYIKGYKTPF